MALRDSIGSFADTALSLVQTRLRLLGIELEEQAARAMAALLLLLVVVVCLLLSVASLIAVIVLSAEPHERVLALWWVVGCLLAVGCIAGIACVWLVRSTKRAFRDSIGELQRDRERLHEFTRR